MKFFDFFEKEKLLIQTYDDIKSRTDIKLSQRFIFDEKKCERLNAKRAAICFVLNTQEEEYKENKFGKKIRVRGIEFTNTLRGLGFEIDVRNEKGEKELSKENIALGKRKIKEQLLGYTVKPTFITESKNGLHVFYILTHPIHLEKQNRAKTNDQYHNVIHGWEKITGFINERLDISSVFRLPGFYHQKTEEKFLIKVIYEDGETINFDDFAKVFPPIEKQKTKAKNSYEVKESGELAETVEEIPLEEILIKLSGNKAVNGENFTFRENTDGSLQIIVDGNETGNWIDRKQNTIGSYKGGGPTIIQWLVYYDIAQGTDNKNATTNAYRVVESLYPHLKQKEQKKIQNKSQKIFFTDLSNAERVNFEFGDQLRFDHKLNRWLIWEKHRWIEDTYAEVDRLVIETMRRLLAYATTIKDADKRAQVASWAIKSNNKNRLVNTREIVKTLKPIADNGEKWDMNKMLLSCPNGIVNLETGDLRNGLRDDWITMTTNTIYDPKATCPQWKIFLDEVFNGDSNLIHYIQKCLGYCITGDTSEQALFIGYGTGANGKSVLVETVANTLGDYAYTAPASAFKKNPFSTMTNDIASLNKKRFVFSVETLVDAKVDEEKLKSLSGGDKQTARYLHKNFFTFSPTCKIWLFLNHRPAVDDGGYGFWRRVKLIPFTKRFTGTRNDPFLKSKLQNEASGILTWLVQGCMLWQQERLKDTPEVVQAATKSYQEENNPLAEFLHDACEEKQEGRERLINLYTAYRNWASKNQLHAKDILSQKAFSQRLADNFTKITPNGIAWYTGIQIKSK